MSDFPIFEQRGTHHWTMEHHGRSVDLRYEQDGLQSSWTVYSGDRLVERCTELMQARRAAMSLVMRVLEAA